ncbi:DUF4126 domain-containing protein [Coraliomargarita akajimensis]|uniref:DUF4126 domain-containing protein n=1 Tax=Coraliomargarita akajimensis (strain DSM 45221 / IAM 15411 / JCM 23193 / KCTC 12865 / 04OKA010-24) TaxID=583355 RepID=D5EKB2_CORAD|nr:DUF4126 domain-containing protein [Coraliomargarita akajimensis]ADE54861.1 conserved hypothetical protein [Coraliomargarita akajimensis DSM 45221]
MNEALAILVGIGLAAACGFRVFVPLFIASLAANTGIDLFGGADFQGMVGEDTAWLGSTPVTIALGVATAVEIAAYYIPWVDNLLDSIATPAAVAAGTFISGILMPEFLGDGSLKWVLALIAGGGTAGVVQGASVVTRGASTASTGGIGNPLVSTTELGGAVLTAGVAVLVPVLAALLVAFLLFVALKKLICRMTNRGATT